MIKLMALLLTLLVGTVPVFAQELLGPRSPAAATRPQTPQVAFDNLWAYKNIPAAKKLSGAGVSVAVLDSGITAHPEFNGKKIQGRDFTGSNSLNDLRGHGTAVAGVIGANGVRFTGLAPKADIIAYKVDYGVLMISPQAMASAMNAVLEYNRQNPEHKIAVVNLSYGVTSGGLPTLTAAINAAYDSGVVVVAPAGNSGYPGVDYPANMPSVIAVGALGADGLIYPTSTYGPQVAFVAPGDRVYSASNDQGYVLTSGTSIASAFVSAAAVLAVEGLKKKLGRWPTVPEVREVLNAAAVKVKGVADIKQGRGMIDISKLEAQF